MPLARITTWVAGNTLTAAALNGEFNNILNNPTSLVSTFLPAPTAQGDILIAASSGADWVRFAVGTTAQVLTGGTTGPVWSVQPTRFIFGPTQAAFPTTDPATLTTSPGANLFAYKELTFTTSATLSADFLTAAFPSGTVVSSATAYIGYRLDGTSTGNIVWRVRHLVAATGVAVDAPTITNNASTAQTLAGVASVYNKISFGLTNTTSWANGNMLMFRLQALATDANYTAVGNPRMQDFAIITV